MLPRLYLHFTNMLVTVGQADDRHVWVDKVGIGYAYGP